MSPEPTTLQEESIGAGRLRLREWMLEAWMLALGVALTLSIHGYRYGTGNQTIYLLDAVRRADPTLLRNDWFTTQTLQYHAAFGWFAELLMRQGVLEPIFAGLYLLLILLFHLAWLGIAKQVSGNSATYLVSLVLYYASAAGTGLGFYQFLQDSSLLPSNLANVLMLWGLWSWIGGRVVISGACFGIAGLFHLNHAVVGVILWSLLCLSELLGSRGAKALAITMGSVLALAPALLNLSLALNARKAAATPTPLGEFIDLYVRLRHPHHYNPASWGVWLWVSFLWPLPFAALWLRNRRNAIASRLRWILILFLSLQGLALLGAGVWFVSETLVQMSLYRFSIFVQLIGCVLAAAWIVERIGETSRLRLIAPAGCVVMVGVCVLRGPFFGAFVMPGDDSGYRQLCDWVRHNTPVDAIFLVPPNESEFRLHARRAIVVNFKAVPQLSGELPRWRDRMLAVLAMDDLRQLPAGYRRTLAAIEQRYRSLPEDSLIAAARAYGARFVVATRALRPHEALNLLYAADHGTYFLYDLGAEDPSSAPTDDRK